ncbi:hypothetical protein BP6252_10107 [Coleophoma cylindrospora]|uniref:Uncharacterized protein n=1 Tax=Coleophoma cylindrospora TaxID=1849047 RepID=A0A3D8QXE8_9HELO|nr:hypothetical protein BP6252_10107 [Coleophoma cylindrospora]
MPRSATDATRFTSTTPHASAKPPSYRGPPNASRLNTPGPTGETPQQKVARLRASAAKARDAKISSFDKFLVHGRVWADRAHRFTTLSLIGITFVCGGVTVYALGDMMIYNRKKRDEYYAQEKALKAAAYDRAKTAVSRGTATEADIAFVKGEDDWAKRMEERKNRPGLWKRSKDWLFSGLKKEDQPEINATSEGAPISEMLRDKALSVRGTESEIIKAAEEKKNSVQDKVAQAFADEKARQKKGGPLDRLGSSDEDDAPKAGGWTSWMNVKR